MRSKGKTSLIHADIIIRECELLAGRHRALLERLADGGMQTRDELEMQAQRAEVCHLFHDDGTDEEQGEKMTALHRAQALEEEIVLLQKQMVEANKVAALCAVADPVGGRRPRWCAAPPAPRAAGPPRPQACRAHGTAV